VFKAFVLVRNLKSGAQVLDFGDFTISVVGPRFNEFREVFSSRDVDPGDWTLEKSYAQLPTDIEDTLLLLRLYKVGDISFIKQAIIDPAGDIFTPAPYRAMNDVNSYSSRELQFEVQPGESRSWKAFADGIRGCPSWTSDWFAAARRFFLTGGAKIFDPNGDDVDRIVDYATALESTLVWEHDYIARRIRHRAAALIASDNPAEMEVIISFLNKFYEIRSRIVHGSKLSDKNREWLSEHWKQVELRVRKILVEAVRRLPPEEEGRRVALAGLNDPTDEDRGSSAYEKFRDIKTPKVRRAIAAKIVQLAGK
jgi:hypothetical protein